LACFRETRYLTLPYLFSHWAMPMCHPAQTAMLNYACEAGEAGKAGASRLAANSPYNHRQPCPPCMHSLAWPSTDLHEWSQD